MEPARNTTTAWPHGRYSGADATGRVHVELDGTARDVRVVLEDGWRSAVGPDLAAFLAGTSFTAS